MKKTKGPGIELGIGRRWRWRIWEKKYSDKRNIFRTIVIRLTAMRSLSLFKEIDSKMLSVNQFHRIYDWQFSDLTIWAQLLNDYASKIYIPQGNTWINEYCIKINSRFKQYRAAWASSTPPNRQKLRKVTKNLRRIRLGTGSSKFATIQGWTRSENSVGSLRRDLSYLPCKVPRKVLRKVPRKVPPFS